MKNITILFPVTLVLFLIFSCATIPEPETPNPNLLINNPKSFKCSPCEGGVYNPKMVTVKVRDGGKIRDYILEEKNGYLVDGDLIYGTVSDFKATSIVNLDARLWSKGIVPYVLPSDFPNRGEIVSAINDFNSKTIVRMVPKNDSHKHYLVFTTTNDKNVSGSSYYGMRGRAQDLKLNIDKRKWNKGTVLHEVCHALGIAHEQNRSDRDKYVRIIGENIKDCYCSQFMQLNNAKDVGEYDFYSIMHYGDKAFSKNNKRTIIPLVKGVKIGQREKLSVGDIKGINRIYRNEVKKR